MTLGGGCWQNRSFDRTNIPDPLVLATPICPIRLHTTGRVIMAPTSLCVLPTEILLMIAGHLDLFSRILLRCSSRLFRGTIPPPTHMELVEAETSQFGIQNALYACQDCLRLRPGAEFADNMLNKSKAKSGCNVRLRWCVDCGLKPASRHYSIHLGQHHRYSKQIIRHLHALPEIRRVVLYKIGSSTSVRRLLAHTRDRGVSQGQQSTARKRPSTSLTG